MTYDLLTSELVRFFTCAGAPASRKRQTHREVGTQSLRASYVWEVAGLSNGSGGATMLRPHRGKA